MTVYGREGLHEVDMGLSKDTRRSLERLLKQQGIPGSGRATVITDGEDSSPEGSDMESISETVSSRSSESDDEPKEEPVSVVEIPLLHNTEFFHILTTELEALDAVQTTAAKTIEKEIVLIGNQVTAVSNPRSSIVSRSDLYPWREIFRIYLEMGIFFSNLEVEQHQERTVEDAQARLNKFRFEMERMGLPKSFKNRQSQALFGRFIEVNEEVLRVLRFQAINKMAMTKILKSLCTPCVTTSTD